MLSGIELIGRRLKLDLVQVIPHIIVAQNAPERALSGPSDLSGVSQLSRSSARKQLPAPATALRGVWTGHRATTLGVGFDLPKSDIKPRSTCVSICLGVRRSTSPGACVQGAS